MLLTNLFYTCIDSDLGSKTFPIRATPVYQLSPTALRNKAIFEGIFKTDHPEYFSVSVPGEDLADLDDLCEHLMPFFFHYQYYMVEDKIPLLFIDCTNLDFFKEDELRQKCQNLGFRNIRTVPLSKNSSAAAILNDANNINTIYADYMLHFSVLDNYLVVDTKSLQKRIEIFDAILKADISFNEIHPSYAKLLQELRNKNQTIEKIKKQLLTLETKLESQQKYLRAYTHSGSYIHKQIKEINEFYHWEYDILPGWYKKMGHVIKVLTRHRTFKSLFSDNVKKYNK